MEGVKETPIQEAEDQEDCPQEEEDQEDCPICQDALPKLSCQLIHLTCCGKGVHKKCVKDLMSTKSMTMKQKLTCFMCKAKPVGNGSKEQIERIGRRREKHGQWKGWLTGTQMVQV